MDDKLVKVLEQGGGIIPKAFIRSGVDNARQTSKLWRTVINSRQLPVVGWDRQTLDGFLKMISAMDSNNAVGNIGVGEREGRIYCDLVAQRHYNLAHGVGRGGNLTAPQPKAAGSSILVILCNSFVLQIFRAQGATDTKRTTVVPVATGMALTLCFLRLCASRKGRQVIWLRCDQASAPKAVLLSGCTLVCVEGKPQGHSVTTNINAIEEAIGRVGAENVLCVLSTTSCFAPRTPDDVLSVARLCKRMDVPHVINNAYGVQSRVMMKMINSAQREGRVDAYVQSTDKNFMVPVGGSIIASANADFVDGIAADYAGRASASPMIDLFMTLLSMGSSGYADLIAQREKNWTLAVKKLTAMGFVRLDVPRNDISMALSIEHLPDDLATTKLGSMLFSRSVSGHRVVLVGNKSKSFGDNTKLEDWGTSGAILCKAYITVAIAIGMSSGEIDDFCTRFSKLITKKEK